MKCYYDDEMTEYEKPAYALFVNACVRKDSRTRKLAERVLSEHAGRFEEVRLSEIAFPVADESFLNKRDRLIAIGDYGNPMFNLARQFAEADEIVIAAPYWDLSFPASLKQYFEQINVLGITFRYTPEGVPQGLCQAKHLTYVTTCGGCSVPEEFGFGYVKTLAQYFYGISDVRQVKAVGLDIDGADEKAILQAADKQIRKIELILV